MSERAVRIMTGLVALTLFASLTVNSFCIAIVGLYARRVLKSKTRPAAVNFHQ